MSERIHALAQLVLGKPSLEECSIEELQHLVKRYPYFAPAQFLMLQKLQATDSPEADLQKQKALLYSHNPLSFESLFTPENFTIDESLLHQPDTASPKDQELPEAAGAQPSETDFIEEQTLLQQHTRTASISEEAALDAAIETAADENSEPENATETGQHEPQHFFVEDLHATEPDETRQQKEEIRQEASYVPVMPAPFETTEENFLNGEEINEEQPFEQTSSGEEEIIAEDQTEEKETEHTEASPATEETFVAPAPTATQVNEQAADEHKLVNLPATKASEGELVFEPFHTVDYFASQGIKISAEELPKDRLGKQLRSFTDWLKIMKRLPAAELAHSAQSAAEKNVENLASHSVEESSVITEAMAEVWIKQGNHQKAIETYNKLSLLDPSKKAYFAAKIENLKGS